MKEVRVVLTLGRRPLRTWVLVANITDEFILGLDILRAYETSVLWMGGSPWTSLDPSHRATGGNRYLLIAMDYFTKWPEVYPIQTTGADSGGRLGD
jgi:hypothetical protein